VQVAVAYVAPAWRTTDDGCRLGLRISATGLAAIGLEPEEPAPEDATLKTSGSPSSHDQEDQEARPVHIPRISSRAAVVRERLSRPSGATLAELASATGWLPHTVRAALTSLRRKGQALRRDRDARGQSTYRLSQAEH
jgi:hypothetical protein